ncbi:MAG: aspartate aminotransferase family protein [Bacillota bacterium]
MLTSEVIEKGRKHISGVIVRDTELVVEKGEGSWLYTSEGERYLDFIAGIAVCNVGHCHPRVVEAAKAQLERLIHISISTAYYESVSELASELARLAPGEIDTCFFSNSGAEAVEGAIKLARYFTKRPGIIGFYGSFHGRTFGAVSLTASSWKYHSYYEPLLPEVYHVSYPYCYRCPYRLSPANCDLECLNEMRTLMRYQVAPDRVACVIMEPVMGEGGYVVPPARYVRELRKLTADHGILLIMDEVQSGFGRTGRMFATEHFQVVPDIMTMAKGIAAGLPLSALAAPRRIMDAWKPGAHGTTFGGNPVSCAAALASLKVIEEENLLGRAAEMGAYMKSRFEQMKQEHPFIGDVRGLGMMVGVEFVHPDGTPNGDAVTYITQRCLEKRLIVHPAGDHKHVLRFMTPLNISREDLDYGLAIIEETMREYRPS